MNLNLLIEKDFRKPLALVVFVLEQERLVFGLECCKQLVDFFCRLYPQLLNILIDHFFPSKSQWLCEVHGYSFPLTIRKKIGLVLELRAFDLLLLRVRLVQTKF